MNSYAMLDGDALDLGGLREAERAYFARCYEAYGAGMAWADFSRRVEGPENPLVRAAGGVITRGVYDHPLFRAVHDLEHRLGTKQGKVGALAGDDVEREPLAAGSSPATTSSASPSRPDRARRSNRRGRRGPPGAAHARAAGWGCPPDSCVPQGGAPAVLQPTERMLALPRVRGERTPRARSGG